MSGGALAAALLLAALALALAFAPRRTALGAGVFAAAATVLIATIAPIPGNTIAFAGCWISLILIALVVYWPHLLRGRNWAYFALAANAALWAALVLRTEQGVSPLLPASAMLLAIPAALFVERGWTIPPRILASWLLAVALLVGTIPLLVVHPGYIGDHRE